MAAARPHRGSGDHRGRDRVLRSTRRTRLTTLAFLAAAVVLGELLVLAPRGRQPVPLSFAVLIVLASSFAADEFALAVLGGRARRVRRRAAARASRVAAPRSCSHACSSRPATLARVSRRAHASFGDRSGSAAVLRGRWRPPRSRSSVDRRPALRTSCKRGELADRRGPPGVARGGVVRDADGDRLPRRRTARASSASGGRCCSRRRCSPPGTRSSGSTRRRSRTGRRSRRWRWRRSSAGSCPRGHAERVAALVGVDGRPARPVGDTISTTSRWRRCCTTSVRSRSTTPKSRGRPEPHEVAAVTSSDAARDPAAGRRRRHRRGRQSTTIAAGLAVQVLRLASEYDDLTVVNGAPPTSRWRRCGPRRGTSTTSACLTRARTLGGRHEQHRRLSGRRGRARGGERGQVDGRPVPLRRFPCRCRSRARRAVRGGLAACRRVAVRGARRDASRLAAAARVVGDVAEADRDDEVAEAEHGVERCRSTMMSPRK